MRELVGANNRRKRDLSTIACLSDDRKMSFIFFISSHFSISNKCQTHSLIYRRTRSDFFLPQMVHMLHVCRGPTFHKIATFHAKRESINRQQRRRGLKKFSDRQLQMSDNFAPVFPKWGFRPQMLLVWAKIFRQEEIFFHNFPTAQNLGGVAITPLGPCHDDTDQ